METVIVERLFPSPLSFEDVVAARDNGQWCNDLYGVTHLRAYVDTAGLRTVCVYHAADTESVRQVNHRFGGFHHQIWRGEVHVHGGDLDSAHGSLRAGETMTVVERTIEPGTKLADLSRREAAGSWCLDQHHVRFLCTYVATGGGRMVCVYAAPDAESVRIAQRTMGMPVDRIWSARLLTR